MTLAGALTAGAGLAFPAAWFAILAFWSFVVTPHVFETLGREEAGALVSPLFTPYYALGTVLGVLGAAGAWAGLPGSLGRYTALVQASALVLTLAAWLGLRPRMQAARAAGDRDAFGRLHGASMVLNLAVAVLLVVAVVLAALAGFS